jgi:hypothetical protein
VVMRYWLFSLAVAIFVVAVGESQEGKKILEKKPDGGQNTVAEVAGKGFYEWAKEIHHKDPAKREVAIKTVLLFGPDKAYSVLPDILSTLELHYKSTVDLSVRVNGVLALGTIFKHKPDADPKYFKRAATLFKVFLKDEQVILRIRTAQALQYLKGDAQFARTEILRMVKDPTTWEARQVAIQTLVILEYDPQNPPKQDVISKLSEVIFPPPPQLPEPAAIVRHAAVHAFGLLGVNMRDSDKAILISRLNTVAFKDADETVKMQAHMSIMTLLNKRTKENIVPIADHLNPKHTSIVRLQALDLLGQIGPPAKPYAVSTVLSMLRDPDVNMGLNALVCLIHMEATETAPELIRIKMDKGTDETLRRGIDETLDQFKEIEKMRKNTKDKK